MFDVFTFFFLMVAMMVTLMIVGEMVVEGFRNFFNAWRD